MGSTKACETAWELMPAARLEDLLPDLSVEEQVRVQNDLREEERIWKRWNNKFPRDPPMHERKHDNCISDVACHALRQYNARHPGGEFDVVKSLMESSVRFRGEVWFHINFWARSRSSNKIKRFFAEVHYKQPTGGSVCSNPPVRIPVAELLARPSASSSVCSDQPVQVPEAEVHSRQSTRSFICMDQPVPVPEADVHDIPPASSSARPFLLRIPVVEVCVIIDEPLGRYRRSCAFCPGHLDILHPRGDRKFVCGNDKDRMVQQFHFSRCKPGRG